MRVKVLYILVPLSLWGWQAWCKSGITPEERFKKAENTFRFQDYRRAVKQLESLLYPVVVLKDPNRILKAHEYLGACFYWLKDKNV